MLIDSEDVLTGLQCDDCGHIFSPRELYDDDYNYNGVYHVTDSGDIISCPQCDSMKLTEKDG
jgi:uncharacterized OB-fold protein